MTFEAAQAVKNPPALVLPEKGQEESLSVTRERKIRLSLNLRGPADA